MTTVDQDRALIAALGGAARVAALLGIDKNGGVQRVHNWKTRGIPASVKVARPDLFMPHLAHLSDPTWPHPGGRPTIDVAAPVKGA